MTHVILVALLFIALCAGLFLIAMGARAIYQVAASRKGRTLKKTKS